MPRERTGWIGKRKDRKGLWARVSYVDETGRSKATWRRVDDRSEGKRVIKEMLRKIEDHGVKIVDGERMTFHELADIYQENKLTEPVYKGETKTKGLRSWRQQISLLGALREHFAKKRISQIRHLDLEKFKLERMQSITVRGKERSVTGVNRELQLMRSMLNFAVREGWLVKNPFERGESLISAADESRRDRILTRNEEERLLAACSGLRAHIRPVLITALDTGMRRGEMLKLIWADVDFDQGLICVRKTTTKTREARTIGMTTRLRSALRELKEVAPPDPNELVFGIKSDLKRSFTTACELAKTEDFHLHDCRHTATTRMIQSGMAPLEVMKITGHKQMATFLRYLNTDSHTARRAASALDEWHLSFDLETKEVEMVN